MRPILLLFLFLIGFQANTQSRYIINRKPIEKDKHTENLTVQIERLANSITTNTLSDAQKVRAIYLWIANNIDYDYELRLSKILQNEIYTSEEKVLEHVLKRKKALCGGYAFLFKQLCEAVQIEARYIHGFTNMATNYRKPNHTWSAVKLNGKWQLLDLTWAISNSKSGYPDDFWYLTDPKEFVRSHYPQDKKWALMLHPPRLEDFTKMAVSP